MRTFILLFSVLLIVLGGMSALVFAQDNSPTTTPPESSRAEQSFEESSKNDSSFFLSAFHALWTLMLLALLLIFHWNSDKQQKVLTPGEKNKEKPNISEWQAAAAKLLYAGLTVAFGILLIGQYWWPAAVLLIATLVITLSHWATVMEIKKSPGTATTHIITEETTTFDDVGGLGEIIEELREAISLYKNQKEAESWDIRPPNGMLLIGPPGCGKTLLARATAGEAGATFIAYSAAEIGNSYVRSGAQAIKDVFDDARAKNPAILFIDEIDALGRKRGYDTSGEFDHALAELLHQMDGIRRQSGLMILAATNREDMLDEALLRPGRFDKKIVLPHPDIVGREQILKVHTAKKRLAVEVNLKDIARKTAGFNGATLEQVANEAAQLARRRYEEEKKKRNAMDAVVESVRGLFVEPERAITMAEFEEAILRVQIGPARKMIMSEDDRKIVSLHEIGHAIVTAENDLEVLERVTLMPRNWALGMTLSYAEESYLPSKKLILAKITSLLGGRAAEEVFNYITTGGGNDFEKAAELARRMVCEWGMGESGPALFSKLGPNTPFGPRPLSERTAAKIDEEVEKIISDCLKEARRIIEGKKAKVEHLAEMLREKGSLDAREIVDELKKATG